jgi:ABC-type transport system involved in cytochrome c biogenesis ATPase subunit/GNAT superfamily N-acetyltransferase
MNTTITVESVIAETPRVAQLRGLFDLPAEARSRLQWNVDLPLEERPWNIGLITGPSGCGKSTIARHLWPAELLHSTHLHWPAGQALVDAFPAETSLKEVAALLSAVGFSSPPAWLRPFAVLSTGQQFRATLARLLAEALAPGSNGLVVCDEFTSVIDRTVARIGSAALARTVRRRGLRFVAISCHDDIIGWLQPDWTFHPAEDRFDWRCLQRRPAIVLEVARCRPDCWRLFAPHHYLSHGLVPSATCFLARVEGRPVAFSAWLPFVGVGRPTRREHRTVTLPDYQGVGIGHALSSLVASMWRGLGYRATSTTTHPALIQSRQRSSFWVLRRAPSLASHRPDRLVRLRHATTRLTAGFEYTGPAMPQRLARLLCGV